MRTHLPILLALALGAGCGQRSDALPSPPLDRFYYPALMAALGPDTLIVESTDIDGRYASGTLLAASADPAVPFLGGLPVEANATELRVIQDDPSVLHGFDEPSASDCGLSGPTAFLGANDRVYRLPLDTGKPACPDGATCSFGLSPRFASTAWPLAVSCPPGPTPATHGTRRVWVGFLRGMNNNGYVGQLTLNDTSAVDGKLHDLDDLVEVNVGPGAPQAFAFDADWNRLYFVTQEYKEAAFLRWIDVGAGGCLPFLDQDGLQDETRGGCHVDGGVDLAQLLPGVRGAEGVDVRLGMQVGACETPVEVGVQCRKAYLAVRIYDADLSAATGNRPLVDLGGQLWVVEIPQTALRPEPRLLRWFDVGNGVARLQVIPRASGPDLVAIVAREDAQLWIYDDATGAIGVGVGRDGNGIPFLGHQLVGLAAALRGGKARLYVSAELDHWVSAVDVDRDSPAASCVVHRDPATAVESCAPSDPLHPNADLLHIKGNL